MGETLKMGVRLLIFTLAAALLLAITNEVTKEPIARQAEATANAARQQVLAQADEFVEVAFEPDARWSDLDAVHEARAQGQTIGYALLVSPRGYKADIEMTLGVTNEGTITLLAINSQSETAGLGSKVAGEEFLSQFPGQAADTGALKNEFDAVTGATVSSKAVLSGLTQAATFLQDQLGITGRAAQTDVDAHEAGEVERLLEALRDQGADEAVAQIENYLQQGG